MRTLDVRTEKSVTQGGPKRVALTGSVTVGRWLRRTHPLIEADITVKVIGETAVAIMQVGFRADPTADGALLPFALLVAGDMGANWLVADAQGPHTDSLAMPIVPGQVDKARRVSACLGYRSVGADVSTGL